jgi:hypothetical protein
MTARHILRLYMPLSFKDSTRLLVPDMAAASWNSDLHRIPAWLKITLLLRPWIFDLVVFPLASKNLECWTDNT